MKKVFNEKNRTNFRVDEDLETSREIDSYYIPLLTGSGEAVYRVEAELDENHPDLDKTLDRLMGMSKINTTGRKVGPNVDDGLFFFEIRKELSETDKEKMFLIRGNRSVPFEKIQNGDPEDFMDLVKRAIFYGEGYNVAAFEDVYFNSTLKKLTTSLPAFKKDTAEENVDFLIDSLPIQNKKEIERPRKTATISIENSVDIEGSFEVSLLKIDFSMNISKE